MVDFKGVTVKFVPHTSTTLFFLCLTHPSNTFIPSGDHKLFFLQFDRSLALGEKKKKKAWRNGTFSRVHWPCEPAFSLLRFVHKPYSLHRRQAQESDTVPARFQSVLMLRDSWRRTRHCWVGTRNWNREQTDVVKRWAQSKSRVMAVLRERGLFSRTIISVSTTWAEIITDRSHPQSWVLFRTAFTRKNTTDTKLLQSEKPLLLSTSNSPFLICSSLFNTRGN